MTILIVDDQENMCWVLSKILSDAGFIARTANTIREALSAFNEGGISAAVIDFRLPDGNAFDLFLELNKRGIHIPCIFMTSYGSSKLRKKALQLGFSAYFDKPFDNNTLTGSLISALGNPYPENSGN